VLTLMSPLVYVVVVELPTLSSTTYWYL
jgi:hypothetical protein